MEATIQRAIKVILSFMLAGAIVHLPDMGAHLPASAAEPIKRHATSLAAPPRAAADFQHFDWVRPDAPKGGVLRQSIIGSFDSLNPFPVAHGQPAAGISLIYDQLFVSTPDEASTVYGLIAEWMSYPEDYSWATFQLRPEARFHDGKPITPEDVIFSFEAQTSVNPNLKNYYRNVESVEKTGPHQVTFRFSAKGNRELPQIVAELQIVPKHWWEGVNARGEKRDMGRSSLEIPLGSGPYRIREFEAGRSVTFERAPDWWAKDLPVARGQYNFDRLQLVYFRDRVPAFEAFKVGQLDVWREYSAKAWAMDFQFEGVRRGEVKVESFPVKRVAGMQGFYFNLRRPQFQDPRVRQAMNYAFDYERANKFLFFDSYARLNSHFDNSELTPTGLPDAGELEILEPLRDKVPPQVFTELFRNPVTRGVGTDRNNLRRAVELLAEAGYQRRGRYLVNDKGQRLSFEFLLNSPSFDRIVQPYMRALESLGFDVRVRLVDTAQYKRRLDSFDFDVVVSILGQSESPGNELRIYYGSAAADTRGTRNVGGIKNPAVDALVEKVVFAKNRDEQVAAVRALDRVLMWNHYVVPHWYLPAERIAFWDKFGRPERLPERSIDILRTWWIDKDAPLARGNTRTAQTNR